MLKILGIAVLTSVGGAALAQTGERSEQWARGVCDMMSQEEMRVCLITKPGDSTGARGPRCDELAQHQIEMCVEQAGRDASPASAGATSVPPRPEPEKKAPPEKK
jgi:hypothetical protein